MNEKLNGLILALKAHCATVDLEMREACKANEWKRAAEKDGELDGLRYAIRIAQELK